MPVTVAVADIVMPVAFSAELELCHHCVRNPESPQPTENSARYFPGCRSASVYAPFAWLTATTGSGTLPNSGSGTGATGAGGAHAPATGFREPPVTVPEMVPSAPRVAPTPVILPPAGTLTSVAAACEALPLYHCGA